MRARGEDPEELTESYIRVINEAISARPENMTIGLHMCRGNLKGMWMGEGGYGPIAEKLFTGLNVDKYFMEYDTERSGDFAPLSHLPKGKLVVLGRHRIPVKWRLSWLTSGIGSG